MSQIYRLGFTGQRPRFGLQLQPVLDLQCPARLPRHAQRLELRASAGDGQQVVFNGVYGPWVIDAEDLLEVNAYRLGLTATAASLAAGTALCLLPGGAANGSSNDAVNGAQQLLPILCATGAAGLGVSLAFIHIYVTPLKRALQVLWAAGVAGGAYLAVSQPEALPLYVASHREAVWLVGPTFAALTGVAIKEGICYGKPEAALLALLAPLTLLGHLSGLAPAALEEVLSVLLAAVAVVFAARKYTQPVKDDIGDKSVFMFRKLPPDEQQRVLQGLSAASGRDDLS